MSGSIIPFDASVWPELSTQLLSFEAALRTKAEAIVSGAGNGYTGPQLRAMVLFEELKLVGDMELAAVLVRGYVLEEIEKEGLWAEHPQGFKTLKDAAQSFGTSVSMLSDTKSLYQIIFPAVQSMGFSIAELWEDIGKSNFRAIIPILRAIISGDKSKGKEVMEMVDKVWEDVDACGPYENDAERKRAAVKHVLDAAQLPSSELSKTLAKYVFNTLLLSIGGKFFLLTAMNEEEKDVLIRRFGKILDIRYVDGNGYTLNQIPEVVQLLEAGQVEEGATL